MDCDLVTGEERKYSREDEEPASHVSCTVEMTNTTANYEVAVIDEIQMVKDFQRGWAWTRALLGLAAEEIHVCGEVERQNYLPIIYCLPTLVLSKGRCDRSCARNYAIDRRRR